MTRANTLTGHMQVGILVLQFQLLQHSMTIAIAFPTGPISSAHDYHYYCPFIIVNAYTGCMQLGVIDLQALVWALAASLTPHQTSAVFSLSNRL